MVIKKVFDGNFDEEVHSAFLKFGKGEFKYKYIIEAKKQKDRWAIKTSAEFANFLVERCLKKIPTGRVEIKGVIISTIDLREVINFEIKKVSNFQGIRKIELDTEVSAREILDLMKTHSRCFFGLSFKLGDCELKIKPKAPKSAKPGKKNEDGPKADFCSLKTTDRAIVNDLIFDVADFKEIKIQHSIKIETILYPRDVKGMGPEEIRVNSKRKGKVIREIVVDGTSKTSEAEFEA